MMNIKHFFGLAVIAAMTASCSSSDDLAGNAGTGANETTGVGYATFSINLPTTSGNYTRADKEPTYDSGAKGEYKVNNATLLVFQKNGDSEGSYKFVESVDLGNMNPWGGGDSDNGITTEATLTAKLEKVALTGTDYYALVLLNNKAANDDETGTDDLKVTLPNSGETYADWNVASNANSASYIKHDKGFFMANAPQYQSADADPQTLVKIQKICSTEQEAKDEANTTNIYVERGVAKVTMEADNGKNYFAETGANATSTNYANDKVQINKWALDVLNTKTFPVHVANLKAGGSISGQTITGYAGIWGKDRFADSGNTKFKRVHWGIDPNYSTDFADVDKCEDEFQVMGYAEPDEDEPGQYYYNPNSGKTSSPLVTKSGGAGVGGCLVEWNDKHGSDNPLYCLENTFDINHMLQGQTTRVVFEATYTPNALKDSEDKTFFMIGNHTEIYTKDALIAQIKAKAQEVFNESDASKVTVDLAGIATTKGLHALQEGLATIKHGEEEATDEQLKQIDEKLGLEYDEENYVVKTGISTYLNGTSYYIARIKHFGDSQTPWKSGEPTYGDNNDKYLGRYGVLRNNWYDMTVEKISGPGYPDVPEINPTTPDDEDTKYINVSVKILDWAKRSQSVNL